MCCVWVMQWNGYPLQWTTLLYQKLQADFKQKHFIFQWHVIGLCKIIKSWAKYKILMKLRHTLICCQIKPSPTLGQYVHWRQHKVMTRCKLWWQYQQMVASYYQTRFHIAKQFLRSSHCQNVKLQIGWKVIYNGLVGVMGHSRSNRACWCWTHVRDINTRNKSHN